MTESRKVYHPINPANVQDFGAVLRSRHDGCQWNPDEQRGSLVSDEHWRTTRAAFVVGGTIQYRVCISCARSPKWNAHKQVPISR